MGRALRWAPTILWVCSDTTRPLVSSAIFHSQFLIFDPLFRFQGRKIGVPSSKTPAFFLSGYLITVLFYIINVTLIWNRWWYTRHTWTRASKTSPLSWTYYPANAPHQEQYIIWKQVHSARQWLPCEPQMWMNKIHTRNFNLDDINITKIDFYVKKNIKHLSHLFEQQEINIDYETSKCCVWHNNEINPQKSLTFIM